MTFYASLPFIIQIAVTFQYTVYITIMIYYAWLSLPNPLFDSNNAVFHGAYVHPMSWVFVLAFALYVRLMLPTFAEEDKVMRFEGSKYMEYWQYIYNVLLSFLLVCFAMAITELTWDMTITYYWIENGMMSGITLSNFVLTYAFFLTGMGVIAGIMSRTYQRFKYVWIIPIVFGLYHGLWLADGFHISTMIQFRHDIPTQLWELGHWALVPGMFGMLLKKWYEK